jgi:hypothetical protein
LRQVGKLVLGRSVPEHEAAAALAQRGVEVAQRLEHELRARTRRMAPMQQPVVEAEDGDDAIVLLERPAQRRMIVHAEIAREPDERGHAAVTRGCRAGPG